MEASTVHAPAGLARPRLEIGPRLLRLRSDEQLVALLRSGHDEAFQVIYDRYHKRLGAYARQMLPRGYDVDDALQDVFVRAYWALHADNRELALKAWLFRVAHNRCIDELRRPVPPAPEVLALARSRVHDPVAETDTRESLRRLIEDIRRLPDQQRSALLMRELGGMSYCELAAALGTTVPAVKSLLVRARMALTRASEARDTACSEIRHELALAHDHGQRASATARRHMRDCADCRDYRRELRGVRKDLAALVPLGPLAAWCKLLGLPGGSASGASGTGGGSAVIAGTGGASGGTGALVGANHVATLIAAAIASAGGAVGIQHALSSSSRPHAAAAAAAPRHAGPSSSAPASGYATEPARSFRPAGQTIPTGRASAGAAWRSSATRGASDRGPAGSASQTAGSITPTGSVSGQGVSSAIPATGGSGSTPTPTGAVGTTAGLPSTSPVPGSTAEPPPTGSTGTTDPGSSSTGTTAGGSSADGQPTTGTGSGDPGSGTADGQSTGDTQPSGDGSQGGTAGGASDTGSGTPTPSSPDGTVAGSTT
ncbi:MAG: sigma-70 family RNA polymerase sigma factor [Solirubrobacteraceae bacterium]